MGLETRIASRRTVYSGYVSVEERVVEFGEGGRLGRHAFDVAGHPNADWTAVYVVPWEKATKSVTLVREFHQGPGRLMLGCVAGAFDRNKHGSLEEACRAEMSEEARLCGGELHRLVDADSVPELKWSGNAIVPFICVDPVPDISPKGDEIAVNSAA